MAQIFIINNNNKFLREYLDIYYLRSYSKEPLDIYIGMSCEGNYTTESDQIFSHLTIGEVFQFY